MLLPHVCTMPLVLRLSKLWFSRPLCLRTQPFNTPRASRDSSTAETRRTMKQPFSKLKPCITKRLKGNCRISGEDLLIHRLSYISTGLGRSHAHPALSLALFIGIKVEDALHDLVDQETAPQSDAQTSRLPWGKSDGTRARHRRFYRSLLPPIIVGVDSVIPLPLRVLTLGLGRSLAFSLSLSHSYSLTHLHEPTNVVARSRRQFSVGSE